MGLSFDDEATLEGQWVVNSETGEEYMLDLRTGNILAKKTQLGEWINPEIEK